MLLAYYAGYAFCIYLLPIQSLIINCWVVGKDNLTFLIGSQMEHKLAAALCHEDKSNPRWVNGLLAFVLQGLGVENPKLVLFIDQCASSSETLFIANDSPDQS